MRSAEVRIDWEELASRQQRRLSLGINVRSWYYCSLNSSLRASSPFGGYREKYTRERHARRDATALALGFQRS